MSITDELREAINALRVECEEEKEGYGVTWRPEPTRDEFSAIADRIDAAFEDYIQLPKDADGETIHIGDRVEDNERVVRIVLTDGSWEPSVYVEKLPNVLHEYFCNEISHWHEPTVEDVLREFAQKMNENLGMYTGETIDADEWRDADAKTVTEYAAKLRLAGDAE